MKGGKIFFFSNLYIILIYKWNNLLCYYFAPFYYEQIHKKIIFDCTCHIFEQNLFAFYKNNCYHLYLYFLRYISNLLKNYSKSKMIHNFSFNNISYILNIYFHFYNIYADYYSYIAVEEILQPISLCYCF